MANDHLFFPHESDDDLFDLYEERLFEDKQFFTTKTVLPSLYERRFLKMTQRELAFRSLTQTVHEIRSVVQLPWSDTTDFTLNFQQYQSIRAFYLRCVYACATVHDLIHLVRLFIEINEKYSLLWEIPLAENTAGIILSKEPEPVQLQKSVQAFGEAGGKTIGDTQLLTFEGKEILLQEAKRLSLWRKKERVHGNIR